MSTTAALMSGHYFTSHSSPTLSYAACECGRPLNWTTRDVDHARHLLSVAWEQGALQTNMSLTKADADLYNPFKENTNA